MVLDLADAKAPDTLHYADKYFTEVLLPTISCLYARLAVVEDSLKSAGTLADALPDGFKPPSHCR